MVIRFMDPVYKPHRLVVLVLVCLLAVAGTIVLSPDSENPSAVQVAAGDVTTLSADRPVELLDLVPEPLDAGPRWDGFNESLARHQEQAALSYVVAQQEQAAVEYVAVVEAERARQEAEREREREREQDRVQATPSPTTTASAPAAPAPSGRWDTLAQCESNGNWHINTGNGFYGGLQFSLRSWQWVGGTGYPHQHSRATQIAMAERLLARQGWAAWPACTKMLGWR